MRRTFRPTALGLEPRALLSVVQVSNTVQVRPDRASFDVTTVAYNPADHGELDVVEDGVLHRFDAARIGVVYFLDRPGDSGNVFVNETHVISTSVVRGHDETIVNGTAALNGGLDYGDSNTYLVLPGGHQYLRFLGGTHHRFGPRGQTTLLPT